MMLSTISRNTVVCGQPFTMTDYRHDLRMILTIEGLCMLGLMWVRSQKHAAIPMEVKTKKVADEEVSKYCP